MQRTYLYSSFLDLAALENRYLLMRTDRIAFNGILTEAQEYLNICQAAAEASLAKLQQARNQVLETGATFREAQAKLRNFRQEQQLDIGGMSTSVTEEARGAMGDWIYALIDEYDRAKEHHITRVLKRAAFFNVEYAKLKVLAQVFLQSPDTNDSTDVNEQATLLGFMRENFLDYLESSTVNLNPAFTRIKVDLITMLHAVPLPDVETLYHDSALAAWARLQ